MQPRNASTPRPVYAKVKAAADLTAITADVVAFHIQGSTRAAVGGTAAAHIANGLWVYTPTQGETNYTKFAVEFYHIDAEGLGPVVEVLTVSDDFFEYLIEEEAIATDEEIEAKIRDGVGMANADLDVQLAAILAAALAGGGGGGGGSGDATLANQEAILGLLLKFACPVIGLSAHAQEPVEEYRHGTKTMFVEADSAGNRTSVTFVDD